MPMRNRYGYNCQTITFSKMVQLTPILYLDVVPGESLSGSISARVHSAPAVRSVDTRTYLDAYAFHVPFRLLWSGWPDFITRRDTSTAMPRINNAWGFNLENRVTENVAGTWTNNAPWLRYAYNTIVNKFFIQNQTSEIRALTTASPYEVYQRPSTLEVATIESTYENQDTTITTPASVQSVRQAFQADAFAKMRAFYGDRYIDYLAAVGVSTDWGILQEPELLCQYHTDWRFKATPATSNVTSPATTLGETKGVFDSTIKLQFKKKFFAEHGLVCVYVVTRADAHPAALNGPCQPPVLSKVLDTDYWSPERDSLLVTRANTRTFVAPSTPAADTVNWTFPQWEEYRMGINMARGDVIPAAGNFYGMLDAEGASIQTNVYKKQTATAYDSNFSNSITLPTGQHYQATSEVRLLRHSPIKNSTARLKMT